MISVEDVEKIIAAHLPAFPAVSIPLFQAAGCILREAVKADRPIPPFHRVAMDGVAIDFSAWEKGLRCFKVISGPGAGHPPPALPDEYQAVEVTTGAALPAGADCVIPQEIYSREADEIQAGSTAAAERGDNIQPAGTECTMGDIVLPPGVRLTPPRLAVAAAFGKTRLAVADFPKTAVISVGDELCPVSALPQAFQIRESNSWAIRAALSRVGIRECYTEIIPDELTVLKESIPRILQEYGLVIISGSASRGKFDYIPQVLAGAGVKTFFDCVRQKPGKPFHFGTSPRGTSVFVLPGNPVSALVCLYRYVLPALESAAGSKPSPFRALLAQEFRGTKPITYFVPVCVVAGVDGPLTVTPVPLSGSGDYVRAGRSDGFVEVPPGHPVISAGSPLDYYPWF
jgi:molybdopterin molybdotransferase